MPVNSEADLRWVPVGPQGQLADESAVHLDLAGVPRVEERRVLEETVEQVRCRWCDRDDRIELVPRTDGADGAEFLRTVKELLEEPALAL